MQIPNKVRIGILDYEIEMTNQPIIVNNQSCIGCIEYDQLKIKILEELPEQRRMQTLFHEISHGIIHEYKIDVSGDSEKVVDQLANGWLQVMKDNRELIT